MGTKEEKDDDALFYSFEEEKSFGQNFGGGKNDDQKQHEKNRIRNRNLCVQFTKKNSYTYTSLSLSLAP